jgi:hypothetical protein
MRFSLFSRIAFVVFLMNLGANAPTLCAEDKPTQKVFFAEHVLPVLERHCFRCHSAQARRPRAGLRLDSPQGWLSGGDSGPAVVPGKPDQSLLLRAIHYQDANLRMPPAGKLPDAVLADFTQWITEGARVTEAFGRKARVQSEHWAFQPVQRPTVPTHPGSSNPIDAFIQASLQARGLSLSPEADRNTLIRRLSLDLLGLPPTPDEVKDFVEDSSPDAYTRLVDRLLSSPHFGERWGRHWLDLARYADSDGYEMDHPRPHAWRWRDWVIEAVNADMPFDRFTVEQIAGDLLPEANFSQRLATGFHRNTLTNRENGIDKEEFRLKAIVDRVSTTGTVWLGLTIGCAECHSHKYDPISQREFYQLFAFFNNQVDEADLPVPPSGHEKADPKSKEIAYVFQAREKPRSTQIHIGGNFLNKGATVQPDTPGVLPPLKPRLAGQADRLDLARWLVDPDNPLTPRVEVNRLWQHLFGAGLVRTPEDFGTRGEAPTHPLLLDWLASELIRQGWSRKPLIRLIVHSATYRQSSRLAPELGQRDPENRLWARQNRFRLEAEVIRDQYLAVAGLLNHQVGGPGFRPPLPEALRHIGFRLNWPVDRGETLHRRGMYLFFQRNLTLPMLMTFDHPEGKVSCTRRERSNTPLQALTLLNNALFLDAARGLAERLLHVPAGSPQERIAHAFRLCFSRQPEQEELSLLRDLHDRLHHLYQKDREAARALVGDSEASPQAASKRAVWVALCRALMNVDEFVTRE